MSQSLFIINDTRQHQILQVRWKDDHSGRIFARQIFSGRQIEIKDHELGVGSKEKFETIIEHLERMGARDAAELHNSLIEGYNGISYRWNHEISIDEIQMGHEMVLDNADKRSAEESLKAAAGSHLKINEDHRIKAKTSAVEVIQDYDPRKGPDNGNLKFAVTVDPQNGEKIGRLKRRA